jgi:AcrR family transcriptional regulator
MREQRSPTRPSAAIRAQARAAADEVQRRLIAECVCRVIDQEGLEGTTLRRIAAELGCTTGLIAHYFPSKEALLLRALRTAFERLEGALVARGAVREDLNGQLAAFLDALPFDAEQRVYWRVQAAYRGATAAHPVASSEALRWERAAYEALRAVVARELGRPDADSRVALIADALEALMDGIGSAAAVDPGRYSRERVEAMLQACAQGLLATAR